MVSSSFPCIIICSMFSGMYIMRWPSRNLETSRRDHFWVSFLLQLLCCNGGKPEDASRKQSRYFCWRGATLKDGNLQSSHPCLQAFDEAYTASSWFNAEAASQKELQIIAAKLPPGVLITSNHGKIALHKVERWEEWAFLFDFGVVRDHAVKLLSVAKQ